MRNNHGQCANLMMMMMMVFDVAEWKCTIGAGAQGAHLLWQLWEESESGSDSCGGWVYWTNSLKMSFLVEFLINSTLLESDDSGGRINFLVGLLNSLLNRFLSVLWTLCVVQVCRMFSVTSGAGRWQLWATWRLKTFSRECNKWRKDPSYGNNEPSREWLVLVTELPIYCPTSTIFVHYIFFCLLTYPDLLCVIIVTVLKIDQVTRV